MRRVQKCIGGAVNDPPQSTVLQFPSVEIPVIQGLTKNEATKYFSENACGRANFNESFYICDFGEVARMYQEWRAMLPRVRPFYALKVAPYGPLVGCLSKLGAGFDCASQKEIELVLQYGISPSQIIYASPIKQVSQIIEAEKYGVTRTVFDKEEELLKMKEHFPEADLVLRIVTDDSHSNWGLSGRFGATIEDSQYLLRKAQEIGMSVIGISFHVGGGCKDAYAYLKGLEDSKYLFNDAESLGMKFNLLDIGGGFAAVDKSTFDKIAGSVSKKLDEIFPVSDYPDLNVIAEPGRYFSASAFTLATNVICKTASQNDVEVEYTINEGKFGSLMFIEAGETGENEPYHLEECKRRWRTSRLWGPTLDSVDCIFKKRSLPEMNVGDWLFWRNAGSYTFACGGRFNGYGAEKFYNIVSAENAEVFRRQYEKKDDPSGA